MKHNAHTRNKSTAICWAVVEISPQAFENWPVVDYTLIEGDPVAILMSPHGPERGDRVDVYGYSTTPPPPKERW